jgi:hypothetical protein
MACQCEIAEEIQVNHNYSAPPPSLFSSSVASKVLCFDTLLEVFILNGLILLQKGAISHAP